MVYYDTYTITWWHWHFEFIDQAGPMKDMKT